MDGHDGEYVGFAIHESMQQESAVSHEEVCEPTDECILPDALPGVVSDEVNSVITEAQVAVEILTEHSDDDEDKTSMYPIYVKEEPPRYTSGDDESMAVEALRQLGGMYPCFEDKRIRCVKCSSLLSQTEVASHRESCGLTTTGKLSCPTCREVFDRRQDLNNHMVCHQVDRPHSCRTCGNLFRSKSHLQTHMQQVHKAEKAHKCTICGSDFHRPSSLSNHMKIHSYVAGRALAQAETSGSVAGQTEARKKWPDEEAASATSSSNYEVQWSVPYSFGAGVDTIAANDTEKMDTLQEFTVMPNGEVTHFEYASQEPLNSSINQYNIGMSNFASADSLVKIENIQFTGNEAKIYTESDANESTTLTKNSYACGECGASFSRTSALAAHSKIHAANKTWSMPIECEYCDKQFQDSAHLASHQTTCAKKLMRAGNHENGGAPNNKWGKHACSECGKKFTTKQKMFRHQWIHRRKTHTCEICGSQYEKQNELDEHRLSAHPGDSPFTCTECGKSFVSRQGLWEHGRTHAGSPAHFHCDTCSKTFSSRQGYLIHHRTHTGERPYGCKFCWKAFRDGGTLRKHERIHTGERPHVCPLCSRAFNQKVVLREHVRWVHAAGKNETEVSGPPYPCPLCGSLNQDRDELCAHIVKHSDQMIAEAKAKTNNNATKQKTTRKKAKPGNGATSKAIKSESEGSIARNEQSEAFLSIAQPNEDSDILKNREIAEQLLLVSGDKEVTGVATVEDKNDDQTLVIAGQTAILTKMRQTDVLQLIQSAKRHETLRLIASGKANNTLHLITKQNESLPVLAIRNPQSHENFSSQMADNGDVCITADNDSIAGSNAVQDGCLIDGETSAHVSAEQVVRLLQEQRGQRESENDDGDEEMVCGICGDDFDDKNVLMEHVKIHI